MVQRSHTAVVPSTDRGRATRERILDAASELFYRRGVGATRLDQVIAASRTGKGQLYHYFADKRALVHAVIDRQVATVLAGQQARLAQLSAPSDLRAWAGELVAAYQDADHPVRCPLGALVAELAEGDPEARAALDRGLGRWSAALAAGLGRAGVAEPERQATALLAAYQGGLLLSQARGDLGPLRTALDAALAGAGA
jgi:TetR/AcrR family transcriptional regulator, transcriptional repressor for nem operon